MAIDQVILGFGLVALAIALVGIYYVQYLMTRNKPDKKADPITKSILITAFLLFLVYLAELSGVFDSGFTKRWLWVFFVIFLSLIVIYSWVAFKKNPIKPEKLFKIAMGKAEWFVQSRPYLGDASIRPLRVLKVTPGYGRRSDVMNFLFELQNADLTEKLWIQLDIYDAYVMHLQPRPPLYLVDNLLGRESTKPNFGANDEFDGREEKPINIDDEKKV